MHVINQCQTFYIFFAFCKRGGRGGVSNLMLKLIRFKIINKNYVSKNAFTFASTSKLYFFLNYEHLYYTYITYHTIPYHYLPYLLKTCKQEDRTASSYSVNREKKQIDMFSADGKMRMGFYSVYHINLNLSIFLIYAVFLWLWFICMVYFHLIHNYLIKWFTVIILCSITYIKHVASITNKGIICNENFPELETICFSLKKTCIVIIDYFY